MKVTLEKDYKMYYTLEDFERAKAVIKWEKENDEYSLKDWAEYAVKEALKDSNDYVREIYCVSANTARNCRVWDAYGEGTGNMDVWIEFVAQTCDGFIKGGAYLSDIWQTGSISYKERMYIERYVKEGD